MRARYMKNIGGAAKYDDYFHIMKSMCVQYAKRMFCFNSCISVSLHSAHLSSSTLYISQFPRERLLALSFFFVMPLILA